MFKWIKLIYSEHTKLECQLEQLSSNWHVNFSQGNDYLLLIISFVFDGFAITRKMSIASFCLDGFILRKQSSAVL